MFGHHNMSSQLVRLKSHHTFARAMMNLMLTYIHRSFNEDLINQDGVKPHSECARSLDRRCGHQQ